MTTINTTPVQPLISRITASIIRRVQGSRKSRVRGLTRILSAGRRFLPEYRGAIQLADSTRFWIDTQAQPVDFWVFYTGDFEPSITWILRQHTKPGAHCLDIGANVGHYAMRMATWAGSSGRVAAFEPDPDIAARIQRSVNESGYAHVKVIPNAVSDSEGTRTFYIGHKSVYSALDPSQVQQITRSVTLETVTIDDFLQREGWTRLDVIKIDTQGNDCQCILGGKTAIRTHRPFIVFEYQHDTPADLASQVFDLLGACGYTLKTLSPYGELSPFKREAIQSGYVDIACFPSP